MHFPQSTSTGNYVPFQRQIPGRIFRKPAHPESPSHFGRIRARNHRPIRPPINKEASSRTAGHEVHREFRTQRRPLNVAFVLRRAVRAGNLICLRLDRRPDVGAWLVLGVSPNIYKLKATLCGLLCLRKVCPGILVWNGMQFPLGTRLGKCVPLFSWIPGCIFRLRLVGKVRPTLGADSGTWFPVGSHWESSSHFSA